MTLASALNTIDTNIPIAIAQSFHGVNKHHPVYSADQQEKLDWLLLSSLSKTKKRHKYVKWIGNPKVYEPARGLQAPLACIA